MQVLIETRTIICSSQHGLSSVLLGASVCAVSICVPTDYTVYGEYSYTIAPNIAGSQNMRHRLEKKQVPKGRTIRACR